MTTNKMNAPMSGLLLVALWALATPAKAWQFRDGQLLRLDDPQHWKPGGGEQWRHMRF
jgi:hypothetical protein